MPRILLIDDRGRFPLDQQGRPLYIADAKGEGLGAAIRVTDEVYAVRVPRHVVKHVAVRGVSTAHRFATDRVVAHAVALLNNREQYLYDPRDGSRVTFDAHGFVSRGARDLPIFPRLDAAVIGVVENPSRDAILLGMNRHRPGFFSCIAGYVEHGEDLEEAFYREVLEETGRRVHSITYAGSQPWAPSSTLMVGFFAQTEDDTPVRETDEELAEVIWATRNDLGGLKLPMPSSLARTLIEQWASGNYEIRSEK
ncbi:NUDIX domain-containing protein [Corynebacterium breve]|uniref:NAD(+) diphosphatase n=1 Tax=Corynebacterium breve TaxID=3049799 RepID=A0ABY8VHT5_9CORY|nr:NUDIX domain-containing protein [Corynebacterium breve]WIM68305.1 NUDIX domain-containing protein [Corynebacterium breve]